MMAQKKWQEAESLFGALSTAISGDSQRSALYKQGRCLIEQQRLRYAEPVLVRALGTEKRHVPSLNALGQLYMTMRRWDEAKNMFKRSLEVEQYQQGAADVRKALRDIESMRR